MFDFHNAIILKKKVTKEIYEYGKKNKMLYYTTLTGNLMPIAVNFDNSITSQNQNSSSSGVNMTLPF